MRGSVLLEGLLTNIEAWINITKKNLQDLEKQDTILLVSYYLFLGNTSKVFMQLEMGVIPVNCVIMMRKE